MIDEKTFFRLRKCCSRCRRQLRSITKDTQNSIAENSDGRCQREGSSKDFRATTTAGDATFPRAWDVSVNSGDKQLPGKYLNLALRIFSHEM